MTIYKPPSERCKHGHLRTECERIYIRPSDGYVTRICKIQEKAQRTKRLQKKRAEMGKREPAPPPPKTQKGDWIGPAEGLPKRTVKIRLVCSHITYQNRDHFTNMDELWCCRCDKLRHINEVGSWKDGERSTIIYPLEAPPSSGTINSRQNREARVNGL